MSVITALVPKTKRAKTVNTIPNEVKETIVLEILKDAIEKLKEARKEVHKAVLVTLSMKKAGDGVANQVVTAVIELLASDSNSWIIKDCIKEFN